MASLYTPEGMRIPSLAERSRFYSEQFSEDESRDFIRAYNPPVYAIDVGNESGLYIEEHRRFIGRLVYLKNSSSLKEKLIHYSPEDVYYSRNLTRDSALCSSCTRRSTSCPTCPNFKGQELAFDIDPENIECRLCARKSGSSVYSFCAHQLVESKSNAIDLHSYLGEEKGYNDVRIVYSGRGYHIHVLDTAAYSMPVKERTSLADSLVKKGYPIDRWVTAGSIDLIRLPGSLHGLVNRIVKEISLKEIDGFDPLSSKEVIPGYSFTRSLS